MCVDSVSNSYNFCRFLPLILLEEAQYPYNISPSGYLQLEQDVGQWIYDNNDSLMLVKMLELNLPKRFDVERTKNALGKLSNLTHLYISNLDYKCRSLDTVTGLRHLSLENFNYDFQSCNLAMLSNLESLEFRKMDLRKDIYLPVSLRRLSIDYCLIYALPNNMAALSNLITLELRACERIDSLPENLNIVSLKLDGIINPLPLSLRELEILNCKRAYHCRCKLQDCRCFEQCLAKLVNLELFSFTCPYTVSLPSIGRLHSLRVLLLKDCFRLRQLPSDLDELIGLETLDISGTRIKSLPDSFMKLPNLQRVIFPKCFRKDSLTRNLQGFIIDETDEIYHKYKRNHGSFYAISPEDSAIPQFPACLQLNDKTEVSFHNQNSDSNSHFQDGKMITMTLKSNEEIKLTPFVPSNSVPEDNHHVSENEQNNKSRSHTKKGNLQKINITPEKIQKLMSKNITLVDAAKQVQVSRSTMKRRLRELGMKWPSSKKGKRKFEAKKRKLNSETHFKSNPLQQLMISCNTTNDDNMREYEVEANKLPLPNHRPEKYDAVENSTLDPSSENVQEILVAPQCYKDDHHLFEQHLDGPNECTMSNIAQRVGSSNTFAVKASYSDDTVKFDFSCTRSFEELKQELGKRLELEVGTFRIKYEDEDKEWIRMSCISDLEYALHLSRLLGLHYVRLSVMDERFLNGEQKRKKASGENSEHIYLKTKGEKSSQDSKKSVFLVHEDIVSCILPFIEKYTDVKGDGNCGFRSIAVIEYGDEEKWLDVRCDLKEELTTHKELYKRALGGEEGFETACRIVDWDESPAPEKHWYEAMHLGLVVATKYQKVCTLWSKQSPTTFLPLETRLDDQPPTEYINMALIRCNHFIALHMSTCNIPLPRLSPLWIPHCNSGVKAWFLFNFKKQLDHYLQLCKFCPAC